jgi:hypothetical protein
MINDCGAHRNRAAITALATPTNAVISTALAVDGLVAVPSSSSSALTAAAVTEPLVVVKSSVPATVVPD